jgi:hypothetical protein
VHDHSNGTDDTEGKGQLTLPNDIRKAAHPEEGALLEAELTADSILLRSQKLIEATSPPSLTRPLPRC